MKYTIEWDQFWSTYHVKDEFGNIEATYDAEYQAKAYCAELNGQSLNGFNVRDEFKTMTVEEIKAEQEKRHRDFAVAAVNVKNSLNTSTLIRSAVIFGANKFYVIGDKKFDRRGCVGAQNYIDIIHLTIDEAIATIKADGWYPVAIEQNGNHLHNYKHFHFIRKPCIVLGSESDGLPQQMLDEIPYSIEIFQPGVLRSLNVAVAGSIVMNSIFESRT